MSDIAFQPDAPQALLNTPSLNAMAPGAVQQLRRYSDSRSQRRFQQDIETRRMELQNSGVMKPATIINFNPVQLVQDGLIRMRIPQAGYSEQGSRVEWDHQGHRFVGHVVTLRSPILYGQVTGHDEDRSTMSDVPTHRVKEILPIGIAYAFWEHYAGPAHDSPRMGGVLIYQGDKHTLSEEHLTRSEGKILVPEPIVLPDKSRTFRTVEKDLDQVVSQLFDQQAVYADMQIQNAHALSISDDVIQRNCVTDVHRIWARYALEHGMISELPDWVRKRVMTSAEMSAVVRCPVCTTARPFPNVYICPKDGAPYDAYEAFMAGAPVAQQWLDTLPEEKLDLVAKEMVARKNRFKAAMQRAERDAKKPAAEEAN